MRVVADRSQEVVSCVDAVCVGEEIVPGRLSENTGDTSDMLLTFPVLIEVSHKSGVYTTVSIIHLGWDTIPHLHILRLIVNIVTGPKPIPDDLGDRNLEQYAQ